MAYALGKLKGLGVGEDNTTWGTYVAPAASLLVREAIQIKEELAILDAGSVRQSLYANQTDRLIGRKGWSATVPFAVPIKSASFKLLLKQAFGTAGGSGPFVFVKQNENLAIGLVLQQPLGDGTNEIRGSGGRPKSLKFSVTPSGLLVCEAQVVGAVYTTDTATALPAVTVLAEPYWTWRRAAALVDGVSTAISGFDLDIDLGTGDSDAECMVLGSQTPGTYPFNGNLVVKGTINRLYSVDGTAESAFEGKARSGAEGNLTVTFTSGTDVLVFAIECVWGKPTISGEGLITESIPFECRQVVGALTLANGPFSIGITDAA